MFLQDHNVGLGVPGSVVDLLSDLHGRSRQHSASHRWLLESATKLIVTKPLCAHLPVRDVLHDLLFSGERSGVPSVGISVLLGEDEGDEVDPRPCRLSLEFPVEGKFGRSVSISQRLSSREAPGFLLSRPSQ
jgi:hypothetical protein